MARISAVLQLGLLVLAADLILLANPGTSTWFWVIWGALCLLGAVLIFIGWRRTLSIEMDWIEDQWYDYAAASGRWLSALRMKRVDTDRLQEIAHLPDSLGDVYATWESFPAGHEIKHALIDYLSWGEEGDVIAAHQTMKQAYHRWARLLNRHRWNQPSGFAGWIQDRRAIHRPVFELWVYAQCAQFDNRPGVTESPSFVRFQPLWESWKHDHS